MREIIWGTGVTQGSGLKPGEMVRGIPDTTGDVVGDDFLDVNWHEARILLFEQKQAFSLPFRYNIRLNEIHLKSNDAFFAIQGDRIMTISFKSIIGRYTKLVNSKLIQGSGNVSSVKFFEVLDSGFFNLYKGVRLEIRQPTYNVALQSGNKNTEIGKIQEYYYQINDHPLVKLADKKDFKLLIATTKTEKFVHTNMLSLKKEHHLVFYFNYLNERATINP